MQILTNTEKNYALMMDSLCYRNFRMLRYVQEHWKKEQGDIQHLIDELKTQNREEENKH